jgi:Holliday junction DNA helicase RuvA
MLITLRGVITHKADAYAIVEAAGLGYQVFMPGAALSQARLGEEARLWIHDAVKEDGHDLYGFLDEASHRLFKKLLAVSGVGPKSALAILGLGVARDIEARIDRGDIDWLTSVPGIGKKTAQKIVLELKGKLVDAGGEDELVVALMGLGYARDQALAAANTAPTEGGVELRLRDALRKLAQRA